MNEKSNGKKESFVRDLIKLAVKTVVVCGIASGSYIALTRYLINRQMDALKTLFNGEE